MAGRMDALLVSRLGDSATLADGRPVMGAFASPFVGAEIGGGESAGKRLGSVINTDEVLEPTLTVNVQSESSTSGVGPADRTGKSFTRC